MQVKLCLIVLSFLTTLALAHDMTAEILEDYHDLQMVLANDLFEDAQTVARILQRHTEHWLPELPLTDPRRPDVEKMLDGAKAILAVSVTQVEEIRNRFEWVSNPILSLIRRSAELMSGWQLYYCPMVKKYWTQPKSDPKMMNPFMGTQMQQCGSKRPW